MLLQKGLEIILRSLLRVIRCSAGLEMSKSDFYSERGTMNAFYPKAFGPIFLTSFLLNTVEKVTSII